MRAGDRRGARAARLGAVGHLVPIFLEGSGSACCRSCGRRGPCPIATSCGCSTASPASRPRARAGPAPARARARRRPTPDRPAQPAGDPRRAGGGRGPREPQRRAAGDPVRRPRRVQGGQRPPRPRRRRRGPARRSRPPSGGALRQGDVVGRYGGDELLVVAAATRHPEDARAGHGSAPRSGRRPRSRTASTSRSGSPSTRPTATARGADDRRRPGDVPRQARGAGRVVFAGERDPRTRCRATRR